MEPGFISVPDAVISMNKITIIMIFMIATALSGCISEETYLNEIDAEIILPNYTPDKIYTEAVRVEINVTNETIEIEALVYEELYYNETTPENVQEFLDNVPPCPWFEDKDGGMCSSNARYITIEAKAHGLEIGECTVVDTNTDRVKRTLCSGHRVNVFEHDNVKYFTTNLNRHHSDVVTASELTGILGDIFGIDRIETKDYKW